MLIVMPMPLIALAGSVMCAIMRLLTLWDCNHSSLEGTKISTLTGMDKNGSGALDVPNSTTLHASTSPICCVFPTPTTVHSILVKRTEIEGNFDFKRLSGTAGIRSSKRLMFKRLISLKMAKKKNTEKKRRTAKDGRAIAPRDPNSAHKGETLQNWTEKDMQKAFQLKRENPKLSHWKIHKMTGIPYTTVNERLKGRRGTGEGKCAGGKRIPRAMTRGKGKIFSSG